jgi:hypothetical protein
VAGAENDYRQLFDRHRFGFRLQGGEAHQIGSPALDETVVGPALLGYVGPEGRGRAQLPRGPIAPARRAGRDRRRADGCQCGARGCARLLKTSAALRNTMGDAHGKESQAARVPQSIVDLTIHLLVRSSSISPHRTSIDYCRLTPIPRAEAYRRATCNRTVAGEEGGVVRGPVNSNPACSPERSSLGAAALAPKRRPP